MMRLAVLALLVAACSGSSTSGQQAPAPTPAVPIPAAPAPGPAPAVDVTKLGSPCDAGGCPAGVTCTRYYGIAGPQGPEFTSCELPCADGRACPAGTTCVTIADGPGAVCRTP